MAIPETRGWNLWRLAFFSSHTISKCVFVCHRNLSNGQNAKFTYPTSPMHNPLGIYFISKTSPFQEFA